MGLSERGFVVIRKSVDGDEWMDTGSWDYEREGCSKHAIETKKLVPEYCKANPVQRIVLCDMVEVIDEK